MSIVIDILWRLKTRKSTLIVHSCTSSSWENHRLEFHNLFMKNEKPEITKLLSSNIRRLRIEKGFTQEQLSERIGISVRHLSDIERADSFPSPEVIELFAKALELPSAYVLFLPTEIARLEILLNISMKGTLDNEINLAIQRTLERTQQNKDIQN